MRLVGRWLCASITLSVCFTCLLLFLPHDTTLDALYLPLGSPSPTLQPSTTAHQTQQKTTTSILAHQMTPKTTTWQPTTHQMPPRTTTSSKLKPTLISGSNREKLTATTKITIRQTKKPITKPQQRHQQSAETDEQRDYKKRCWKSGFSPASGKPMNHTPEDFLINESGLCSGKMLLLVIVHSEIGSRQRRDLTRRTWASLSSVNGHRIAVIFVVGASGDASQQAALLEESADAADLVQAPCRPDGDPRMSACKALYSLLWASRHCPGAEFLLKVEDHAFVNVFHLTALITGRLADATSTFYCYTAGKVSRVSSKSSTWYVSKEEWPAAEYPVHCKGLAYLMSADLAPRLLRCAAWRNYLRLEDVFITGVLGEALGAKRVHWTAGWDSDWLHPRHDGPAVTGAIVLASMEGVPLPNLQSRVWKAALVYSADFI